MYWDLGFMKVFLCTIVSPYFFIVKFLRRLRGGRQFAEPRKFLCSLCVLVINFRLFTVIDLSSGVLSAQQVVSEPG